MKPTLTNRIRKYLDKKRPTPKATQVESMEITPEGELKQAWESWKEEFRVLIRIFKTISWVIFIVAFMWALSAVDI